MKKYKTMTITEEQANRYKFPAKAIGDWAIIKETEEQMILHRLTKSGQLGSDRPNNILKVKKLKLNELFKAENPMEGTVLTAKASDGKEVVIVRSHKEDISDTANEPQIEKNPEETVKMDAPQSNRWKELNVGTRKSRWIAQLLEQMKSEPFTLGLVEKLGEEKIVHTILADTNPERQGGKIYSSISSAMRVWNMRAMRGDF
mgnify:CR=1 FL=1